MGVRGTFQFLNTFAVQIKKLDDFKNKRCAIDVNSWIGRPLSSIHKKVKLMRAMSNKQKSNLLAEITAIMNKTVCDFVQKIKLLKSHNIRMLFVFDGRWPQIKRLVERAREIRKMEKGEACKDHSDNSDREEELKKQGQFNFLRFHEIQTGKLLTLNYRKEIEEVMISTVMRILKDLKIDFMVAPFQTDNQITQLYYKQEIDFAISGDSDFIFYIVPLITEFDMQGECIYYFLKDFVLPREIRDPRNNIKNFLKVAQDKKKLAILASLSDSGYTKKIEGLEIYEITSLVLISENLEQTFAKINKYLENKFLSYQGLSFFQKTSARNAYIYYLHAVCYNPKTEKLEWLNQELVPETRKQFNLTKQEFIKITENPQIKYSYILRTGVISIWTNEERQLLPLLHFYQDVDTKVKNDRLFSIKHWFNYRYEQNNTAIAVMNLLW